MEPVVSYEHDDGAVRQAALLHRRQGPPHLVVHEADGGVVGSPQLSHLGLWVGHVRLTNVWDSRPLR